jgi:hypothetical protein
MELLTFEEKVDSPRRNAPVLISIRRRFSVIEVTRVGAPPAAQQRSSGGVQ